MSEQAIKGKDYDWKGGLIDGRAPLAGTIDQIQVSYGTSAFTAAEIYQPLMKALATATRMRDVIADEPWWKFWSGDPVMEAAKVRARDNVQEILALVSMVQNLIEGGPPIYAEKGTPPVESLTFEPETYWHRRITNTLKLPAIFVSGLISHQMMVRGQISDFPSDMVGWIADQFKKGIGAITGIPPWVWGVGLLGFAAIYASRLLPTRKA